MGRATCEGQSLCCRPACKDRLHRGIFWRRRVVACRKPGLGRERFQGVPRVMLVLSPWWLNRNDWLTRSEKPVQDKCSQLRLLVRRGQQMPHNLNGRCCFCLGSGPTRYSDSCLLNLLCWKVAIPRRLASTYSYSDCHDCFRDCGHLRAAPCDQGVQGAHIQIPCESECYLTRKNESLSGHASGGSFSERDSASSQSRPL